MPKSPHFRYIESSSRLNFIKNAKKERELDFEPKSFSVFCFYSSHGSILYVFPALFFLKTYNTKTRGFQSISYKIGRRAAPAIHETNILNQENYFYILCLLKSVAATSHTKTLVFLKCSNSSSFEMLRENEEHANRL